MARRMASLLLRLGEGVGEGFFTQKVPGSTDATARAAGVRVLMGGFISVCAGTASKNAGARGKPRSSPVMARVPACAQNRVGVRRGRQGARAAPRPRAVPRGRAQLGSPCGRA